MRGEKTQLLWLDIDYQKRMSEAHKGKHSPNKGKCGLWKHTAETIATMSKQRKGHPFHGPFKHTDAAKAKVSRSLRDYWSANRPRRLILNNNIAKGLRGKRLSQHHREHLSQSHRGIKQPTWLVRKRIQASAKTSARKPTLPEQIMIDIIAKHRLPFTYNGSRAGFFVGTRVPDFISSTGDKTVLEVFGRAFHDPDYSGLKISPARTYDGTITYYKGQGYNCIIFWEDELMEEKVLRRLEV